MAARIPDRLRGPGCGIAAAALFGLSAPLSKLLLRDVKPLFLAALLYLGSGIALSALALARPRQPSGARREAPLRRSDLPVLALIALAGGVVGPVLMLLGLQRLSGVAGALLLNLEAPFTILLAVLLFGEHLGWQEVAGAALVIVGAAALGVGPIEAGFSLVGTLAIGAACLAWALDNNLTQRLSLRDPVEVVRWKSLGAGLLTLALAVARGEIAAAPGTIALALLLGAASFAASILLDAHALRLLGAAREAAYFATAPFLGAVAALPLLGERLSAVDLAAATAMGGGVLVVLATRHSHGHVHAAELHEHRHVHDEHHRHEHAAEEEGREPHSHPHWHAPLEHEHPHVSDLHHRHRHR